MAQPVLTQQDTLTLLQPTETMEHAFADFLSEFHAAGETVIHGAGSMARDDVDFAARVQRARDEAAGVNRPQGHVPASTYWLVSSDRIIGTANLRHRLNKHLRKVGGHIGYAVRPSERRKGYATRLLAMVLDEARQHGLHAVLLTCDRDNVASARVITNNGGVYQDAHRCPDTGEIMQHYWIAL